MFSFYLLLYGGFIVIKSLILLSQKTFNEVYHLSNVHAPVQLNNPAIISVPLSFLTLVIVSLITQKTKARNGEQENIPAEEAEEIAK